MNLSPRWTDFLSRNGFEAIHWSEIGSADAPDTDIMDYAAVNGYTVFTHDLDFGTALAKTRADKPSVIQVRVADLDPKMTAIPIIRLLLQNADEIEDGAIVTIDETKTRIHILPFSSREL
jgi:predicted nuclease of predicted toxin-antitoxin system